MKEREIKWEGVRERESGREEGTKRDIKIAGERQRFRECDR
jgi:hypothetical protein